MGHHLEMEGVLLVCLALALGGSAALTYPTIRNFLVIPSENSMK